MQKIVAAIVTTRMMKLWVKVKDYRSKLAVMREKKEESKAKASFSSISPSVSVPLLELPSSFDCCCITIIIFHCDLCS